MVDERFSWLRVDDKLIVQWKEPGECGFGWELVFPDLLQEVVQEYYNYCLQNHKRLIDRVKKLLINNRNDTLDPIL